MTSTLVTWAVFLSEVAALGLVPAIVLSRKSAPASLAWLFWVFLAPVLGPVSYWLFGRDSLDRGLAKKRRRASARVREPLLRSARALGNVGPKPPAEALPERFQAVARTASRLGEWPVYAGNKVELLTEVSAKYARLLADIARAQRQIHFEYYIWRPDATGGRFVNALAARAREGLEVLVLLDAVGCMDFPAAYIQRLEAASARVAFFHPVNPLRRRFNVNHRNHRKIAVIDGRVAYTGGANIGDEYLGLDPTLGPWRDTAVRIAGPAAEALQRVFLEDWHFSTGEVLAREGDFPACPEEGVAHAQVVASGPDEDQGSLHRVLFTAITSARRSVEVTTPYFVPDEPIRLALETAALRGVNVRILIPAISDNRMVTLAAYWYIRTLVAAGAHIFLFEKGFIHAKTLAVDESIAFVGSANMDVRSFRLNFEAGVIVYDQAFCSRLHGLFERDLKSSRELSARELRRHGTFRRTLEALAHLASPML